MNRMSITYTPTPFWPDLRTELKAVKPEVFLDTCVYFGIYCRVCDNRIPLVEVISGPKVYQWFVPNIPRFQVHCDQCGVSRIYHSRHVFVFEAQTLTNFWKHPAFRFV